MDKIIIAQATPIGSGAIALIRLSGKDTRELVNKVSILKSKKTILEVKTHTINYGTIIDKNNEIIDEVLFLIMDAPSSFTGEDTIEITCHNNQYIIENIIKRFCELGARPANRGEFTLRAFENNKIDIMQAEAINELIHASNELSVKTALNQLSGSLSEQINTIDSKLCTIAAWCQANFEFIEEERDFTKNIIEKIESLIKEINNISNNYNKSKIIKDGIRIAILGTVNAGKSSLFNALIKKEKAIVTNIPGTTRDSIEYSICRNGLNWTFIDTAGIRQTEDIIEKEGILRSFSEAENANLILILYDPIANLSNDIEEFYLNISEKYKEKSLFLIGKSDLLNSNFENKFIESILISSISNIGINKIWKKLDSLILNNYSTISTPYILNKRHLDILIYIENELILILTMLNSNKVYYEIILMHIHQIQYSISNLTGKSISEESLNKVFSEFCVGK